MEVVEYIVGSKIPPESSCVCVDVFPHAILCLSMYREQKASFSKNFKQFLSKTKVRKLRTKLVKSRLMPNMVIVVSHTPR